jgi:hypothetical protein
MKFTPMKIISNEWDFNSEFPILNLTTLNKKESYEI